MDKREMQKLSEEPLYMVLQGIWHPCWQKIASIFPTIPDGTFRDGTPF